MNPKILFRYNLLNENVCSSEFRKRELCGNSVRSLECAFTNMSQHCLTLRERDFRIANLDAI